MNKKQNKNIEFQSGFDRGFKRLDSIDPLRREVGFSKCIHVVLGSLYNNNIRSDIFYQILTILEQNWNWDLHAI